MSAERPKRPILDSTTYYNYVPAELIDCMKRSIAELNEKVERLEARLSYIELLEDEESTLHEEH